jgi:receptor tyrosine kinase-like orphan receptor 1
MEIPLASIRFLQELGEGAFGKVYKGELAGYSTVGTVSSLVAIKTLKPGAATKTRTDFVRESELMTDLRHPNIVCLVGVCLQEEPQCMVFEHMAHGDLHEFLIFHSPKSDSSQDSEGESHDSRVLSQGEMAYIAIQVRINMGILYFTPSSVARWLRGWSTCRPTTMCTGTWRPGTPWYGCCLHRTDNSILPFHRSGRISR